MAACRVPYGHVKVAANRNLIKKLDLENTDNYITSSNVKYLGKNGIGYWYNMGNISIFKNLLP